MSKCVIRNAVARYEQFQYNVRIWNIISRHWKLIIVEKFDICDNEMRRLHTIFSITIWRYTRMSPHPSSIFHSTVCCSVFGINHVQITAFGREKPTSTHNKHTERILCIFPKGADVWRWAWGRACSYPFRQIEKININNNERTNIGKFEHLKISQHKNRSPTKCFNHWFSLNITQKYNNSLWAECQRKLWFLVSQ